MKKVWGGELAYGSKTVDLHVQRLRKKVGWRKPCGPFTRWATGWRQNHELPLENRPVHGLPGLPAVWGGQLRADLPVLQTALAREEAAARASYDLLFRTLQMVESVEVWSGPQDAAQAIAQLSAQGNQSWAALSLETDQKTFLTQGTIPEGFLDLSGLVDPSHYAQSAFSYQGRHYLQLSGQLEVQGAPLLLHVAYDISSVYQTRQQQQQAHGRIFSPSVCRLCRALLCHCPDPHPAVGQARPHGPAAGRRGPVLPDGHHLGR